MFEPGWLEMITPDLQRIGPVQSKQVALIKRCVDFIDHQIPENRPLWAACRWAEDCWRADHGQRPPLMSARIPYVGPEYPSQRIAVVAINSRDSGRADDEIHATAEVVEWLAQGHRDYGARSFFHYRLASVVHTAIRSSAGERVEEMPDPPVAATALAASARLQAVQCSPQSSSRRSPTGAMTRHCPEFLLRGQLEILEPRLLILLGAPAHRDRDSAKTRDDLEHDMGRERTLLLMRPNQIPGPKNDGLGISPPSTHRLAPVVASLHGKPPRPPAQPQLKGRCRTLRPRPGRSADKPLT